MSLALTTKYNLSLVAQKTAKQQQVELFSFWLEMYFQDPTDENLKTSLKAYECPEFEIAYKNPR